MRAGLQLKGEQAFALSHAVLIYSDGQRSFATLHDPIDGEKAGPPALGPGRLTTTAFLKTLSKQLGESVPADVLPANVLVRTSDVTVWWRPPAIEALFYNPSKDAKHGAELVKLSGRRVPVPALVFRATRSGLWVRALRDNRRPDATTTLAAAPFYNVGKTGSVCLGSMRRPHGRGLDTLPLWERAFFESEFTHVLPGVTPTSHKGGFRAMWSELAAATGRRGPSEFPVKWLVPKRQTLAAFVAAESGGDW